MRRPLFRPAAALILVVVLLTNAPPTRADTLVADLSDYLVSITSNFSGAQIFAFGTIEIQDEDTDFPGLEPFDIVVVMRGPPDDVTVRRKEQVAGIWINGESVSFEKVPGFIYVASTRPLEEIADDRTLGRLSIGLEHVRPGVLAQDPASALANEGTAPEPGETGAPLPDAETVSQPPADPELRIKRDLFRRAMIWEKARKGLYIENPGSVDVRGNRLFRTQIDLPALVPVGAYTVTFYLVREGKVTSAQTSHLFVERSDIEHLIYRFAHEQPLLYGLFAVVIASLAGFGASALFRKS